MVGGRIERTCIITGAGSGLGRAMTLGLAAAGANVVAADVDLQAAEATAAQCAAPPARILPLRVDLRQPEQCEALIGRTRSEFGKVEVLVNCAGLNMALFSRAFLTKLVRFWEVDPEKWQLLYDVNVRAPFLLARSAAPQMIARRWGRIVNVTTSLSTMIRGGNTPYGQAKAALEAASAGWAADLAGTGVTCNVLIPGGAADTPMIPSEAPVDRAKLVNPTAMVAPLCYLASDASDTVTGMRLLASKWTAGGDLAANLAAAMAPAAWPGPAIAAGAAPRGSAVTA